MEQIDLFDKIDMGASFSDCRNYRYALWRIWDKSKPLIMFIGLNPSTANEDKDDPTIRRVRRFAKDWDYGGFYMMNLFGLVSSDPQKILESIDPIGDNDNWLEEIAKKCDKIIFAWGSFFEARIRAKEIIQKYNGYALIINRDGTPRHPLYVKSNTIPIKYTIH